jgi:4-hydroxy-tetrahydrodipicolinate reductase
MSDLLRIIVNGAMGRMGQAVIDCSKVDPEVALVAEIDVGDDLRSVVDNCDAVIDFSHHTATARVAEICRNHRKILVIGTTGHTDAEIEQIRNSGESIPVVLAPNFSVGVNALFWLTRKAAEILGPDFDLEVVEMHHRLKTDAPSGTAKRLAEILAEARNLNYSTDTRHGRHGIVGERTNHEIGVHAIRGGDVVGDHTVIFSGIGERVELTHKASSRQTFARGAIRAAKWARLQKPGLYDMQDVLGLT